jgi:hypothetical protein
MIGVDTRESVLMNCLEEPKGKKRSGDLWRGPLPRYPNCFC